MRVAPRLASNVPPSPLDAAENEGSPSLGPNHDDDESINDPPPPMSMAAAADAVAAGPSWTLSEAVHDTDPLDAYFSRPIAAKLCMAAKHGELGVVVRLLSNGEHGQALESGDLDAVSHRRTDLHGCSALHYAAGRPDSSNIVIALLNDARLADANTRSDAGSTALHHAARSGDATSVSALATSPRVDPNLQDRQGHTALHVALRARNHAAVERLISNPRVDINLRCHRGCSPLMSAVEHGSDLGVARLLAARSGPQRSISDLHSPRSAVTPPTVTIYPTSIVSTSIWDGQQLSDSATPQARSCDVNATDRSGWAPIHVAVRSSDSRLQGIAARLIGDMRTDVNLAGGSQGWTPLHAASAYGRVLGVARLLSVPAVLAHSLRATDANGVSALELARQRHHGAEVSPILPSLCLPFPCALQLHR